MNLITLAEYKAYKGITNDNDDDAISMIIDNASKLVKTYCGRTFIDNVTVNKVEKFDARTAEVVLAEVPLLSVSLVTTSIDGGLTQVTLTEADSDATGYFVDLEEGRVLTQIEDQNFLDSVGTPYRSLEITYLGGFTDSVGVAEVPHDLRLAVLDMVSYYVNDEKKPGKSLASANIDNVPSTLVNGFPPHIVRILQLYRHIDL
jgi:uncharacterized phiE125 gp8 family phage protein